METTFQHLHTFFLFPFSIDKQAVGIDHRDIWSKHPRWMNGLEEWLHLPVTGIGEAFSRRMGTWRRSPYKDFDLDSQAYQDMVFFHPFVRRVFFDSAECWGDADRE